MRWVDRPGAATRDGMTRLVQAVAERGGAVGWLSVPSAEDVQVWLDGLLASGARLAALEDGAELLACGAWRRHEGAPLRLMAEVTKVMMLPEARGRGAARQVVQALIDDATAAGVELLTLECRGNNHRALSVYANAGFVVTGRRPDAVAVGDDRFDQVLMHRDLRVGMHALRRHGGRAEGPGQS